MKEDNNQGSLSRRKFIGKSTAAAAAIVVLPVASCASPAGEEKVSKASFGSKFSGVQIGAITYSWRDQPSGAEQVLQYCKDAGISSIELMGDVVEAYAGLPPTPTELPEKLNEAQQARADGLTKQYKMTLEDFKKTVEKNVWPMIVSYVIGTTDEQVKWRLSVPMTKFEELRKMYNDAGVEIHIAKMQPSSLSDGEIDYAFKVAKALGAKGITDESGLDTAKKLAPFAEKHGMYAVMHNHFQFADPKFNVDEILAVSKSIMLNFDCGHYFGSTGLNPAVFIKKYHERIYTLHIKDKTGPKTTPPNENQVWGQGETPLAEVLLLLKEHSKEEGWPKYADIELEYPVAKWSDSVKEVGKCVAYARQILI